MKVRIRNVECPFCGNGVFAGHTDRIEERHTKSIDELFNFCNHVAFFNVWSTSQLTNIKSKITSQHEQIMLNAADVLDDYHEIEKNKNKQYKRQRSIEILGWDNSRLAQTITYWFEDCKVERREGYIEVSVGRQSESQDFEVWFLSIGEDHMYEEPPNQMDIIPD